MSYMTLCNEARDTLMKLAVSRFVTSYVTLCNALCHTLQRDMAASHVHSAMPHLPISLLATTIEQ